MDYIENLPLHDALVHHFELDWRNATLKINLLVFTRREFAAVPYTLSFSGVSDFQAPHQCPWGESCAINNVERTARGCKIEMQSGDVLMIDALQYSFEAVCL